MTLRILLVDDTKAHLALAQHALKALPDLDVVSEERPAIAVGRLEKENFDLVVTDLVFPSRLSGIDVAHVATAHHIPVVIISGSYQRVQNGIPQYEKPLRFDDWCAMFAEIVESVRPPLRAVG